MYIEIHIFVIKHFLCESDIAEIQDRGYHFRVGVMAGQEGKKGQMNRWHAIGDVFLSGKGFLDVNCIY